MQLILRAYTVKPFQVVSSRSLETDRYDIVAKVPFGATVQQVNVMLRNLLEERIGLVVHYEARGGPVYEMVIGKRGLKMNPAAPATPSATPPSEATVPTNLAPGMFIGNDDKYELAPGYPNIIVDAVDASTTRVTARMQGVPELIRMIERQTGRTVRDRTGLKGRYDFTFTFTHRAQGASSLSTPPPSDAASDPSSDFLAALESELGLKLVSKRGPVDILVVDSWSKVPVNR
jgi:uncharacterized protein (TIGR03435 family)